MIRKLAMALAALWLCGCAQALAVCVVQTAHMAALVTPEGDLIARADEVFALVDDALYAIGSAGDYALCGVNGHPLNDSRYEMLEARGDVILFRQGGQYGAMDMTGVVLIPPEWAQLTYAGDGRFLALRGDLYDDQPDEMVSITPGGDPLNTGSLTANGLRAFREGRMPFMLSDGQYGYVDGAGRQVIPPQWRWAGDFEGGVAIVSDEGGMGLIDPEGGIVVAPTCAWMQRGTGWIAGWFDDGKLNVYSADGTEVLFSLEGVTEAETCGDLLVTRDGETARLYDAGGNCMLEATSDALFYPGLDGQVIAMDGAWGTACQYLIAPDGSVASGRYQRILPLCVGRYAYLAFLTDASYDDARYGLLSGDGRELLPAEYREIKPAGEGRLSLLTEDAVILADLNGNAIRTWPIIETAAPNSGAGA